MTEAALWRIERPGSENFPLIVNVPHAGTILPAAIVPKLTSAGLRVPDTDWHVDKLYDFAPAMGATLMVATHSRIVVDLNRDPSGDALYPGTSNTEICPTATFLNEPIYQPGLAPDGAEITARLARSARQSRSSASGRSASEQRSAVLPESSRGTRFHGDFPDQDGRFFPSAERLFVIGRG